MDGKQREGDPSTGGGEPEDSEDERASGSFRSLLAEAARISEPAPVFRSNPFSTGALLARGRLRIGHRLGRGGMGVVYEAFDHERRSRVALKTLSLLDGAGIYRLKREFRVLAEVLHPNLVELYELFAIDGHWFFTMELIEGERFDSWVRPGNVLDEARLRAALPQVLGAVRAIHRTGKLHRDLKPSNVLVTAAGRVVVLDFGLATRPQEAPGQTATGGALSGTPAYMAPEQAAGAGATTATDLYAVGVMLFEAIAGKLPFEGAPGQIMAAKQIALAPQLTPQCAPAIRDLCGVCDRLLRPAPLERPTLEDVARLLGVTPTGTTPSSVPATPSGVALFGRAAELEALRTAYQHSLASRPTVAFVSGESGIGKTALVDAFLGELRSQRNAVILQGRCYERELVPFNAFDLLVDDLSRHLRRLSREKAAELMPRDISALARLFPVLERVESVAAAPVRDVLDPQELRRRAFVALAEMLGRIRDREPLVIYVDDLQWLDTDSVVLVKYLLENSDPAPLLLITSYRSEAVTSSSLLREVLAAVDRNRAFATRELRLAPLEAEPATELARSVLGGGDHALAARIAQEAQGSPFFVTELARRAPIASPVALTLQEALTERVTQLPPAARRLLQVVVVAGRPIAETVALQAGTADHRAVDHLCNEQLLRHTSGAEERTLECYHDRIREIVGSSLSRADTTLAHRQLMDALLQHAGTDPEHLAIHCEGAGELALAAGYAARAADAAHAALAFDRAAMFYRTALRYVPESASERPILLQRLASALSDGGRGAEAAPLFLQAAAAAAPADALELRRRAAEQWLGSGYIQEGLQTYSQVLGAVGLRLPRSPQTALIDIVRFRFLLWLRGLGFRARSEREIPAAQLLRIDACKTAWALSFVSTIRASAFQARHLWYALRAGEPNRIALGFGMEAVYQSLGGRRSLARVSALQAAARRLVGQLGNPHVEAFVELADGQASYMLGQWERACDSLTRAEASLVRDCHNVSWELNSTRFFWGNALVFRGRWRELEARVDTWLKDAQWRGDLYAGATLQVLRARSVTLARGDGAAVREEVADALARWSAPEFGVQQFLAHVCLIQVDLFEGKPQQAVDRVAELWPMFSKSLMSRIQLCRVSTHQHAAYAALAMAEIDSDKRRWLAQASAHARVLKRESVDWATAFVHFIEAAVARLQGRNAAALAGLEQATVAFQGVDMGCYAAAATRQLGVMLGGERGAALIAKADTFFAGEGVTQPHKLAQMMAPGFSSAAS